MSANPAWSSGDVITITTTTTHSEDFIVDMKGKASFSLAYKEKPYHRLNITSTGEVEVRNCIGKHSFFLLEKKELVATKETSERVSEGVSKHCFKSASKIKLKVNKEVTVTNGEVQKQQQVEEEHYYLCYSKVTSKLEAVSESILSTSLTSECSNSNYECYFDINLKRNFSYSDMSNVTSSSALMRVPKVIHKWEKYRLKSEGYLVIPGVVLPSKVFECAHLLAHSLGIPGSVSAGGTQEGLGKLGGYLSNCDEVRSLLLHPETCKGSVVSVLNIVEELLGQGMVDLGSISGQIALRFPEYAHDSVLCSDKSTFRQLHDGSLPVGSAWHTDGLRQGKYHGFSMLVGVCLSDCLEDFAGNLLVWPGSHIPIHQSLVGDHGGLDLELLSSLLGADENHSKSIASNNRHVESTNNSSEATTALHDNAPEDLPSLGLPHQVKMKAGDVVFVHPDTAHCGGPNFSCIIRNMVYFRIKRNNIRENDDLYRHDMWVDYDSTFHCL
jgi:hypothetical protein